MRRRLLAVAALALVGVLVYELGIRETVLTPKVRLPHEVATIGVGADEVAVGRNGVVLGWLPPPEAESLPRLPLAVPPKRGRLAGHALQQLRVLAATPRQLIPYVEGSSYGESGVDVQLRSGIELRFGDASQLKKKWEAAAAVLADPDVTALDYIDLHVPRKAAIYGSGHTLPPLP